MDEELQAIAAAAAAAAVSREQARRDRRDRWHEEHRAELEARRQEREADREERRGRRGSDPLRATSEGRFEIEQAERIAANIARGVEDPRPAERHGQPFTVEDYRELRRQREDAMRTTPPLAEQMAQAPIVNAGGRP
ncbi:MAG TPA: hypothetical protein VIV06_11890 [Candidatus Limnocylindrales bacterium]